MQLDRKVSLIKVSFQLTNSGDRRSFVFCTLFLIVTVSLFILESPWKINEVVHSYFELTKKGIFVKVRSKPIFWAFSLKNLYNKEKNVSSVVEGVAREGV